jgi:hypothetical protein
MTQRFRRLSHSIYECKYHIVFCPKYRYRIFKDEIGEYAKQQVYQLCKQKEDGRSLGVECASGPYTSGDLASAEICGVGIHGVLEGQNGLAVVPTV